MIAIRVRITLESKGKNIVVPYHHEQLLHGLIYANIRDEQFRDKLHNDSHYRYEKRQFRMFCFSKLQGRFQRHEEKIVFNPPVSFFFTTYDEKLLREFVASLFAKDSIRLGHQEVHLHSIEQVSGNISEHMAIRFLTPVTVYSTVILNNKKKTYFYSPTETEFSEMIRSNACRKYEAIHGKPPDDPRIWIRPIEPKTLRRRSVIFKNTLIKGWLGHFEISGSPELLQLLFDVGIGAKNSNGMGLFEVVRHFGKE